MQQAPASILLIDDDTLYLKVLAEAFSDSGFQVATATNGNEGIKAFLDSRPTVVVCDLVMPGMGGVSTCMAIRKIAGDREPVIIMLTSMFRGAPRLLEAPEMGARIHIPKSTHPLNVVILVEQLIYRPGGSSANVA